MSSFVLATANPDKAKEIEEIVGPSLCLVRRPAEVPDVEETGETLLDNARLKARALVAATGTPAIADDTGLEVDGLGGAPGVYSARYAGEGATYADNVAKLLGALAEAEAGAGAGFGARARAAAGVSRRARFRTVAVAAWPDGREAVAEGVVEGIIAGEARGEGGFGYDPVFIPDGGGGRTFAEMAASRKNALSHRARAFRALAGLLAGTG
ncbi:MAG: RdgB/HAM1 family non-canonical purine NTP pyrophosphatase [Acidimicrobiales bacterium]